MRVSSHIHKQLIDLLERHRIVVWHDSERAFAEFAQAFRAPNCRVVSAAQSTLRARREAEQVYRHLNEAVDTSTARANLLIYVPRPRAANNDERVQDPFEVFACAGAVFGDQDAHRLVSLARQAMPELSEQIDGLFLSAHPTLEMLDRLTASSVYPLVAEALGTQSPVEACVALLGSIESATRVDQMEGARGELLRLLEAELGFVPSPKPRTTKALREQLGRYILISELAFDLPAVLPDSLANVPRAELRHRERVYTICERLRAADDTRDAYIALANRIEQTMKLRDHFQGVTQLGQRDTFAFEERQYLIALDEVVQTADMVSARAILDGRRKSVWRHQPERAQIWQVAERCVSLIEYATTLTNGAAKLTALVEAYTRENGWSELDRLQRLMEQSLADCAECAEVQAIVELTRRRYREGIDRLQERFLKQVQAEGWPPEGVLRQTQIFDHTIAPALERREKVAYILADSLRFEMGRALANELAMLGDVTIRPAAAALPTITLNGMAALLPGADGALYLRSEGDQFVPTIGDHPLKDSNARMALLLERYGDRFTHQTLGEWLDYPEKKRASLTAHVGLFVLRVPDIDELGEHVSLRQARKHISELLGDLKIAVTQLARLSFQLIVIAADHGHVLLPEVLAGDTVRAPEGEWGLSKRRSRLGTRAKEQAGSMFFKPSRLGIQTDAPDYCVPMGFGVYASDANYFHEGLSLAECIVPLIELHPTGQVTTSGRQQQIEIRYPREQFTSQVIGLKVYYASLLSEPLRIRLEAYDTADLKGAPVGEAADCAARDENTHEVTLQPNAETDVPVLIAPDFPGIAVEIRAVAPDSGVVWARRKLKNGIMV